MVKLRWLGHAAWLIEGAAAKVVIDPFIKNNPKAPVKVEELKDIDLVIVTHNHFDHFGDSIEIANRNKAKFAAVFETVNEASKNGLQESLALGMNKGGPLEEAVEGIEMAITDAVHTGNESGVILKIDSVVIYHSGDTGLFGDMELIGRLFSPDIALLPIGGHFTMGPKEAAEAVKMIRPKVAIPMHYGTFPAISKDPEEFRKAVGTIAKVEVLNPGDVFEYKSE
ncbi:MAG: metal-dependent hydrolase [Candidatus Micrarchaeaceae archaeon]